MVTLPFFKHIKRIIMPKIRIVIPRGGERSYNQGEAHGTGGSILFLNLGIDV